MHFAGIPFLRFELGKLWSQLPALPSHCQECEPLLRPAAGAIRETVRPVSEADQSEHVLPGQFA